MPFIPPLRRLDILEHRILPQTPGDQCFIYYREMLNLWRKNPCWTTAHLIYESVTNNVSPQTGYEVTYHANQLALRLAWQVFFQLHVMPYEIQKREENGEVNA